MPEGFDIADISGVPSWTQYLVCARSVLVALERDDPEDTLMVQLTTAELGLVVFGLMVMQRLFPEFKGACNTLSLKLAELAEVQEFFDQPEGDGPSNEGS